jgi:rRNA pseudouridine-1189 N-methylase Emg1 (Nep1/Mra1 family)
MYSHVLSHSQLMGAAIDNLLFRINEELRTQRDFVQLLGLMDTLFAVSSK